MSSSSVGNGDSVPAVLASGSRRGGERGRGGGRAQQNKRHGGGKGARASIRARGWAARGRLGRRGGRLATGQYHTHVVTSTTAYAYHVASTHCTPAPRMAHLAGRGHYTMNSVCTCVDLDDGAPLAPDFRSEHSLWRFLSSYRASPTQRHVFSCLRIVCKTPSTRVHPYFDRMILESIGGAKKFTPEFSGAGGRGIRFGGRIMHCQCRSASSPCPERRSPSSLNAVPAGEGQACVWIGQSGSAHQVTLHPKLTKTWETEKDGFQDDHDSPQDKAPFLGGEIPEESESLTGCRAR